MSEVVQFRAATRCAICQSKETVATAYVVIDGIETTKHFCLIHQNSASASFGPAIKDG